MTDCAVCGRDYSLDIVAPQPPPRYTMSNAEQVELWNIKNQSYKQNRSRLILLSRDLFSGDTNNNLLVNGVAGTDNTSRSKVPWLNGAIQGINFTSDPQHVEFDRLHTTRLHKTLIRTMPDRSANINDVSWALRNAETHQIGMNVLLLHRWSFVWISILPPPADNNRYLSAQHTSLLIAELQKKYFLLKLQFGSINKLLAGVARVEWHNYASFKDLVFSGKDRSFYNESATCAACHQASHTPATNTATNTEFSGQLTNGDLAELLILKEFSFGTEEPMVGFLSGVSGADRSRSIETKLQTENARKFSKEAAGYFRRLKNIILFDASDELWDNHEGEQTVFRTMPDRSAGIKDLTWALEASDRHRIDMDVYLLHKRHFLWIHVKTPEINGDVNEARKARVRTRLLVSKVKQDHTLKKNNLRKLNKALYPTAKIDYFKYPDLSWVQSITEDSVNQSILAMQILAAVGLGVLVYNDGAWAPAEWVGQPIFGAARAVGNTVWGPFARGVGSAASYGADNVHRLKTPITFAAKGLAKPVEYVYRGGKMVTKAVARALLADEYREFRELRRKQAGDGTQGNKQPPQEETFDGAPEGDFEGAEDFEDMPEEEGDFQGAEDFEEGDFEGAEDFEDGEDLPEEGAEPRVRFEPGPNGASEEDPTIRLDADGLIEGFKKFADGNGEGAATRFDEHGRPTLPTCLPECRDNEEVAGFDCNNCAFHENLHTDGAQGGKTAGAVGGGPAAGNIAGR